MSWDEFVYGLVTLIVVVFIAWLLFAPAAGHAPLVQFTHPQEIQ